MEYSKSEWRALPYGNGNFYIEAGERQVATVHYYPVDKSDKLARANAQLIASAPDLYEALLAIINSETIKSRDNFNNALEALAKAEGK